MSNRLHIVIGFDSVKARSNPTVIYCGRDATAARDAMVPEPAYAMKKWVRNPRGVRKVNPDFVSHRSVPSTDTGEGNLPGEGVAEEPTFPGAPSQEAEGPDPQGSDQLPENASAGTGEGDLPGAEATEPQATEPETSETASATPGSLAPKGKSKK